MFLTVARLRHGQLKDETLKELANHGNGHHAYIDTLDEAQEGVRRAGRRAGVRREGREVPGRVQPGEASPPTGSSATRTGS